MEYGIMFNSSVQPHSNPTFHKEEQQNVFILYFLRMEMEMMTISPSIQFQKQGFRNDYSDDQTTIRPDPDRLHYSISM
jgi:hypothetical protein